MPENSHPDAVAQNSIKSCLLIYARMYEVIQLMADSAAQSRQDLGWRGIVTPDPSPTGQFYNGIPIKSGPESLRDLIQVQRQDGFDHVTLVVGGSVPALPPDQMLQSGTIFGHLGFHLIKLTPFLHADRDAILPNLPIKAFSYPEKRWLELGLASLIAIVLLPIFGLIALGNFINAPKEPIFFGQWRPGLMGKPFLLYKFRTFSGTTELSDAMGVEANARITIWGSFLRRWRLDELPQLWNVILGDMALIGPRPLLMCDQPSTHDRLRVRPGLTGWAQINGGQLLSIQEKNALDLFYVRRVSLLFDLTVLALTAWRLFKGDQLHEKALQEAFQERTLGLASEVQPIER